MLRKVEETIEGTIIRNENGLEIPPVKYSKNVNWNRSLLRIQYSKGSKEKSKEDQKIIDILMGDDVAPRKEFITSNALEVANLDI